MIDPAVLWAAAGVLTVVLVVVLRMALSRLDHSKYNDGKRGGSNE